MTEDRRNFILFAVLAAVILLGWQFVVDKVAPPASPPATVVVDGKSKPVVNASADPTADSPSATRTRAAVLADGPRIRIDTPALSGSINLRGARLDDLVLKRHKESLAANSPPIRLFSPAGAPGAYFARLGWRNGPAADAEWRASSTLLAPGRPVTLEAANATGQRFRIELAVDDNYLFTIKQTVLNAGTGAFAVAPFGYINRSGAFEEPDYWTMHAGPMWVGGGSAHYGPDFDDLDDSQSAFRSTGGWLGFTDKFWLTALVPDQRQAFDGQFRAGPNKAYQAEFSLAERALNPGQTLTTSSRLFAGAKEVALLDRYTDAGIAPQLDYAIDWGWFRIVEKPIFYYLDWLFRLVGNFGVAIILLTVTIRALLYPIANKQFASMAAMKLVQPKMKALQDRHKDDRETMQREVMALYKAEGVNPLAGCLPVLLQIPIFYALYKVLMLTIEMRHQPFVAWIRDLSAPDPLTPINLFGFLPFDPPGFLHLGVLAILLGVTMWLQFKLNPAATDPTTQQVMMLMPWVMMFIFAPLGAGLQLYYVASNIISIGQQKLLYMRYPQMSAAPAK